MEGLEREKIAIGNLSEGPNSLNGCLSARVATGESPVTRTTKHINKPQGFVYVLFVFLKSWRGGDLKGRKLP